jgi:hypothetical protein
MKKRSGMIFLLFISALALLVSCRGGGEEKDGWKYIGTIKDEKGAAVNVYMDVAHLEIDGNKRKFWIRYMALNPEAETQEEYIRQTGYWEINCFDMTLYRLGEQYFSPGGKLLGKTEKRAREEYNSYESLGAKMSEMACRYAGR